MLDLLFKDILVADGSGEKAFVASVGVKDGKIQTVAKEIKEEAKTVILGKEGMVLAPGFIDTHSHNDMLRFLDPYQSPQLLQGVTYDLCGNCGISAAPVPQDSVKQNLLKKYIGTVMPVDRYLEPWLKMDTFKKYMDEVKRVGVKIHCGTFVGHGTVRICVMGMDNRAPTAQELEEMKGLVREAMEAGALGLSTGLIYTPGVYSQTDELIELCKVVKEYDGIYATHMRNESFNVVESVKEAISVAKAAGVKLLVSHVKVVGDKEKTKHKAILKLMDDARSEGMTIICDQYLYNYGSTLLNAIFPPKYQSEGGEKLVEKLNDPSIRPEILKDLESDVTYENFFAIQGPQSLLIVSCPKTKQYNGKHIDVIAKEMGVSPSTAAAELMVQNDGRVLVAIRLSEEDVIEELWKHPFTAMGSDGIGAGTGQLTHPRAYGAVVRVFETYVREKGVTTLEEAVRKCTSLPADFLGLKTKGRIKEGYDADIVVFDQNRIGTGATFENPICSPHGISYVFVDGNMVLKDDKVV